MSMRGGIGDMSVTDVVNSAISMGAPTYNMGDHQGCHDIYKSTALSLMGRRNLANSDRMVLEDGLRNAKMAS